MQFYICLSVLKLIVLMKTPLELKHIAIKTNKNKVLFVKSRGIILENAVLHLCKCFKVYCPDEDPFRVETCCYKTIKMEFCLLVTNNYPLCFKERHFFHNRNDQLELHVNTESKF
jgi:hypothetical protein